MASLIKQRIEFFRKRLIDLTNRNPLTNFKHGEKSRTHIRIVDELPDEILDKLTSGSPMEFRALPQPDRDPEDENTPEFRRALTSAELTDAEYLRKLGELDGITDQVDERDEIERELRDRVRRSLGLPERADPDRSIREYAKSQGIDPDYELPEPVDGSDLSEHHQDKLLQTLLLQDPMDRKLSGIYDRYRLSMQELGVNTLYVCFGFLEWTAREDSAKRMLAPLLLQQADLERKKGKQRYRYLLRKSDDDSIVNLALEYRLKHEYGLELPPFEDEDSVETYLAKLKAGFSTSHPTWKVRRFVTVGHFSFAKLAMFHDLASDRWDFEQHTVIRDLLLGTDSEAGTFLPPIDIDEHEKRSPLPVTITDADSSQLTAIIDAAEGKNLAIKGPPGTVNRPGNPRERIS